MNEIAFIDGAYIVDGDPIVIPPHGIGLEYVYLSQKPKINGVELVGNKTSADLNISGGGIGYTIGDGLKVTNDVLAVDKADMVTGNDTRPVTSQAVSIQIGNIETALQTI